VIYQNATALVTVDLAAGTADGDASVGHDTFSGVNSATGSAFGDTLSGAATSDSFVGLGGNDLIDGRGGFDTAIYNINTTGGVNINMTSGVVTGDGSVGTDTLRSIEGVQGSNFDDTYVATGYGGGGALNIGNNGTFNAFQGNAGNDTITGNGNTEIQYSNSTGSVNVNLTTGIATGDGSVGTDTITVGTVFRVLGSNFGDTITGTSGADTLNGNGGNDTITGNGGNDSLTGGAGADTFVYTSGGEADSITDFNRGQGDRIDVSGIVGASNLQFIQSHAFSQGANTLIDFGGGNSITLQNVTVGSQRRSTSAPATVASTSSKALAATTSSLATGTRGCFTPTPRQP